MVACSVKRYSIRSTLNVARIALWPDQVHIRVDFQLLRKTTAIGGDHGNDHSKKARYGDQYARGAARALPCGFDLRGDSRHGIPSQVFKGTICSFAGLKTETLNSANHHYSFGSTKSNLYKCLWAVLVISAQLIGAEYDFYPRPRNLDVYRRLYMAAYSFKRRFIEPIQSGSKAQTIRADRKRHARAGEELQLYAGMRTKACTLIGRAACMSVQPIRIVVPRARRAPEIFIFDAAGVLTRQIDGPRGLDHFARSDGFKDFDDLHDFWCAEHPAVDTFHGVLIRWQPIALSRAI